MSSESMHDRLLHELLETHRQLAGLAEDDAEARYRLLSQIDELRNQLSEQPRPVGEVERRLIKDQLRALRALRSEYARVAKGIRWANQVPIWAFWRRFKDLSLEDRPSFPVARRPGDRHRAPSWSTQPAYLLFQPEMHAINERIATLQQRLRRPQRRLRPWVRAPRRHPHPDDEEKRRR